MQPFIDQEKAPPGWLRDVAVFRFSYGEALSCARRTAEAREQWTAALGLIEKQLVIQPQDPRLLSDRDELRARLGSRHGTSAASKQRCS